MQNLSTAKQRELRARNGFIWLLHQSGVDEKTLRSYTGLREARIRKILLAIDTAVEEQMTLLVEGKKHPYEPPKTPQYVEQQERNVWMWFQRQNGRTLVDIAAAVPVTGQQLAISLNSVTIDLNTPVDLTGQNLTTAINSVTITTNTPVNLTGNNLTGTTGQLYVGAWAPVNTGQSIVWTEVAA
jgi:hypothetical protein